MLSYLGNIMRGAGLEHATMLGMGNSGRSRRWADGVIMASTMTLIKAVAVSSDWNGW